jgi:hypothetical protein
MSGHGGHRGHRGNRRRRWYVALAVPALALPACSQDIAEPPNMVDDARLADVRADPVLVGALAEPASVETGSSDSAYLRAQVVLPTDVDPAARVGAAREAGWRVTYVACRPVRTAGPARVAQAFKTMRVPVAGGGTYTVGLRIEDGRATAVIPYHLDAPDPFGAPRAEVTLEQSCLENPGAAEAGHEVTIAAPVARVRS